MLHTIKNMDWATRWLVLQATWWLFIANLLLWCVPFRWIKPMLKARWGKQTHPPSEPVVTLGRIIRKVAHRAPWRTTCLVQALAGKIMLARHGFRSFVFIGVAKDRDQQVAAHAWLKCGDIYVTGGAERAQFNAVAGFGDQSHSVSGS